MEGADKHTVFLVDDDEAIRSYLALILSEEGFHVIGEASSIDKAEKQLHLRPATVVFLDINLPGENGLAALNKLRVSHPETSFIMISGDSCAENRQAAMAEGARGFLAKPFTIAKVTQEIALALELMA